MSETGDKKLQYAILRYLSDMKEGNVPGTDVENLDVALECLRYVL